MAHIIDDILGAFDYRGGVVNEAPDKKTLDRTSNEWLKIARSKRWGAGSRKNIELPQKTKEPLQIDIQPGVPPNSDLI